MKECFTCSVSENEDLQIWSDQLVVVNHYIASPGETERPGWIIVSPQRHLTRWWELTNVERHQIADITSVIDHTLTKHYGALRTMVASLGWQIEDHLHFHCVPIVAESKHRGYQVFQGDYVPLDVPTKDVIETIASELHSLHSNKKYYHDH